MIYFSPNVALIMDSPPSPHMHLGVEDDRPSVVGSAVASWACGKEDAQLHKLVGEEGAEITDSEVGIKEHQDDDNTGCRGDKELGGGGTSSAGANDSDHERNGIDYYDLHSLLAKISHAICHDLRYSATGMFWDWLQRRG